MGDYPLGVCGAGQQPRRCVGEDDVRLRSGEIQGDQRSAPEVGRIDGIEADPVIATGGNQNNVGCSGIDDSSGGSGEQHPGAATARGDCDVRVEGTGCVGDRECGGALAVDQRREQVVALI